MQTMQLHVVNKFRLLDFTKHLMCVFCKYSISESKCTVTFAHDLAAATC